MEKISKREDGFRDDARFYYRWIKMAEINLEVMLEFYFPFGIKILKIRCD